MTVTASSEWKALKALAAKERTPLAQLDAVEPARGEQLSFEVAGLTIDLSNQPLDRETVDALTALAGAQDTSGALKAMIDGAHVNPTEDRPALHMALRGAAGGEAITREVADARAQARAFAEAVRSGARKGATGRTLRHIVHIGIGGSALGPMLLAEALKRRLDPGFTLRFAANVDPADINDALEGLDPEATLVFVVSKSFTTQETRLNAEAARAWLAATLGEKAGEHVVAITARPDRAQEFGVRPDSIFAFSDWVGGRYSVWSAASLAVETALEPGVFDDFLAGAAAMDAHARDAQGADNAPLMMALAEIWNRNFLGRSARAVIPYSRRLTLLPMFLQQLEMESNGKGVTRSGAALAAPAQPVVFGAPGTDAQHAFFQQLHQGLDVTPVDFVGAVADAEARPEQHRVLLANMLAQAAALKLGKSEGEARQEMRAAGASEAEADALAAHRRFPGDRPSTTILMDELGARTLGALIALYEHKVYFESVVWGINAFDQWGVELGKTIAKDVQYALDQAASAGETAETVTKLDGATLRQIARIRLKPE